ncbi:hypothetical protein [Arthrobacter woluwensis]|uniref:hypothetical protein n=1 Tax=Arthrobacter woluwensis TaxID=156980 RepID=UPI0015E62C8A|nr:hypothetical protein [Arthrobacter woluwensis]
MNATVSNSSTKDAIAATMPNTSAVTPNPFPVFRVAAVVDSGKISNTLLPRRGV